MMYETKVSGGEAVAACASCVSQLCLSETLGDSSHNTDSTVVQEGIGNSLVRVNRDLLGFKIYARISPIDLMVEGVARRA